ncbi:hypothetical protein N7492_009281 [Penicillium capsulatum]|uniref:Uncharacterized protein n=1 Tax=Penicillium capsulatum TaxID=69766 RepID=A0A9W9LHS2_9EURO|nr:hypothetical protein N7492_009281 [Penicillium capsulatum]KAJ6106675.1 hypothetical protein N7512_010192 [Penicillium capsulatum]
MFPRNYEPLSKSDHDGDNGADSDTTITSRPRRRSVSRFLKRNLGAITITGLLLVVVLLIVCDLVFISVKLPSKFVLVNQAPTSDEGPGRRQCLPPAPRTILTCGNSTAEAKSLGCTYDPLTACWLPEQCPRDFTDEFAHFNDGKPFIYYYDEAATRQMKDYEEVGMNENGFYWTSVREHLVHCLYLLRRGHDVHMRGDRLDSMLGNIEHVDHCTDFLANWFRRDDPALNHIGTQGKTNCFMSCS